MEKTLLNILRALVEAPEDLMIWEVKGDHSIFIEIRCAPRDMACLVGKNGKTINALRVLMNALHRGKQQIIIEVIEPVPAAK